MKKYSKKKVNKQVNDNSLQKINQEQQIFEKVSRTFTANYLRPSQHKKIMNVIHQQIKRPETSKNLRRDYKNLMDLADCNKIIVESRQRSMVSYKKMKNINIETTQKKIYQPVFAQIQNTQGNLSKKKYQKYDLKKFKLYLKQQQMKQNSLQLFVENTLFQGMRDIKNYIPIQAKLHKKLCIFGTLLQQQKYHYVQEVKNMIVKQKQKTPNMSINYQIYLINYYLMQKMMEKICSDSTTLQLKRRNSQVYSLIKNQMIGEIINQKKFADMLKIMEQHVENEQKNKIQPENKKTIYNYHHKSRLNQKLKVGRHNRYGSDYQNQLASRQTTIKSKQNQLVLQFQKLYEQAQERINQAKLELNFPTSRKNNFYSMIEMKLNDEQKEQDVF